MNSILFILALLACSALSARSEYKCDPVFQRNGISERFPGVVAHACHSISAEDLREFFDPSATSRNSIPVVNPDLRSEVPILHDAPEPGSSPFSTPAMRLIDRVLNHMDDKFFDVRGYNALERITHAMHMREVWFEASSRYALLQNSSIPADLCTCALDIENNGIMDILPFIALKLREPGLVYGKHVTVNDRVYDWSGNVYSYGFGAVSPSALATVQDTTIPPLQNHSSWEFWKDFMMKNMVSTDAQEFAVFVHCALHA